MTIVDGIKLGIGIILAGLGLQIVLAAVGFIASLIGF